MKLESSRDPSVRIPVEVGSLEVVVDEAFRDVVEEAVSVSSALSSPSLLLVLVLVGSISSPDCVADTDTLLWSSCRAITRKLCAVVC
jgi:hypothetical protein